MTEADLQRLVYERLCWEPNVIPFRFNCGRLVGGHYQAITWGAGRLNSGVADLGVMVPGGLRVWLELKQPGKKQRTNQVEFARVVRELGCEYHVIRSLDDVEKILADLRR